MRCAITKEQQQAFVTDVIEDLLFINNSNSEFDPIVHMNEFKGKMLESLEEWDGNKEELITDYLSELPSVYLAVLSKPKAFSKKFRDAIQAKFSEIYNLQELAEDPNRYEEFKNFLFPAVSEEDLNTDLQQVDFETVDKRDKVSIASSFEMLKKLENTPQAWALLIGVIASEFYIKPEERNPDNIFEVILFSSTEIFELMKKKLPNYYEKFQIDYFNELEKFAIDYGIKSKIKQDFNEFIEKRLELYSIELKILLQNPDVLPTKTAYYFFKEPLSLSCDNYLNVIKLIELKSKINELRRSKIFEDSIDKMIYDLKLSDDLKPIKNEPDEIAINQMPHSIDEEENVFVILTIDQLLADFPDYFKSKQSE